MDTARAPGPPYQWSDIAWIGVPMHLRAGLARYVDEGITTGAGLRGLLTNGPVFETLGQLDDATISRALQIMQFLYSAAPSACWGTKTKVERWIALGGYRNGAAITNIHSVQFVPYGGASHHVDILSRHPRAQKPADRSSRVTARYERQGSRVYIHQIIRSDDGAQIEISDSAMHALKALILEDAARGTAADG